MAEIQNPHVREVAIDVEIARAYEAVWRAQEKEEQFAYRLADSIACAAHNAGQREFEYPVPVRRRGRPVLVKTDAVLAHWENLADKVDLNDYHWERLPEYVNRLVEARATVEAARLAFDLAEQQYEGWARFYLVQNNGGHIHKERWCQTCNKRGKATRFGWLPELAALTEAEAVAAHGAVLCTVCFPTAPVEWTDGRKVDDDQ